MTFSHLWLEMAPCERQKPFHFLHTNDGKKILIKDILNLIQFKLVQNEGYNNFATFSVMRKFEKITIQSQGKLITNDTSASISRGCLGYLARAMALLFFSDSIGIFVICPRQQVFFSFAIRHY